jgi:hypothetical protein
VKLLKLNFFKIIIHTTNVKSKTIKCIKLKPETISFVILKIAYAVAFFVVEIVENVVVY